jgi:hypothetical protein
MSDPTAPAPFVSLPATPDPPQDDAPSRPKRRGLVAGAVALGVVLVAGAVAVAVTQSGGSAEAQPLALRFAEGQTESYEIGMSLDATVSSDAADFPGEIPLVMEMTEVVTWEVVSVDDEGNATIEVSIDEMSGSVSGFEIPSEATDMPPTEIAVAPDGRLVSIDGVSMEGLGQMPGSGFPGMGQLTPLLPDEGVAVAPGDTWTKEFSQEMPFGEGVVELTATSRYDRNEDVNGREAAVIVTEMTIPFDLSFDFEDLAAFGQGLGATGPTGLDALGDATVSASGSATIMQTSYVDLEAEELLRTESAGDVDVEMALGQMPGFEDATVNFAGTFTQELERR